MVYLLFLFLRYTLVESIPENLTYGEGSPTHPTTYSAWKTLLSIATETIDIGSFYWSLKSGDIYKDPSDWEVLIFIFVKYIYNYITVDHVTTKLIGMVIQHIKLLNFVF